MCHGAFKLTWPWFTIQILNWWWLSKTLFKLSKPNPVKPMFPSVFFTFLVFLTERWKYSCHVAFVAFILICIYCISEWRDVIPLDLRLAILEDSDDLQRSLFKLKLYPKSSILPYETYENGFGLCTVSYVWKEKVQFQKEKLHKVENGPCWLRYQSFCCFPSFLYFLNVSPM